MEIRQLALRTQSPDVELTRRAGDGIELSELWSRFADHVTELKVDGRSARNAYRHLLA